MLQISALALPLDHTPEDLSALLIATLGVTATDVAHWQITKRSMDARQARVLVVYSVWVRLHAEALEHQVLHQLAANAHNAHNAHIRLAPDRHYTLVMPPPHVDPNCSRLRPVVVGMGPCGLFAALLLAQMKLYPIVLERGKPVRERTKDTWGLWRKRILQPESNVQFGEGGAGTFSDGKLYSQIKDPRFLGYKVMTELVKAGAPPEILIDAHPHIGTFKLVKVVQNLRQQIIALGGEVRFETRVTDLLLHAPLDANKRCLRGLVVCDADGKHQEILADQVIFAVGHSARDTFAMLHERGVALAAKAFSVGCRIEHPQSQIDLARWGRHAGHPALGAADYKLVHHASNGRTVYSFCMCPGGTVVAATSEPGRVVTNGMSQYSRRERNANAALVVGVTPCDYPQDSAAFVQAFGDAAGAHYADQASRRMANPGIACSAVHPLAGINLQRRLESLAYQAGGGGYQAPAQMVQDLMAGQASSGFADVQPSYQPGVTPADLQNCLPPYVVMALREALPLFGHKIAGFDRPDAMLTGVETRTSSPLRMPRGDDWQSTNTQGLYPGGEGAGYAGGILSAAIDGIQLAEAVAHSS